MFKELRLLRFIVCLKNQEQKPYWKNTGLSPLLPLAFSFFALVIFSRSSVQLRRSAKNGAPPPKKGEKKGEGERTPLRTKGPALNFMALVLISAVVHLIEHLDEATSLS